MVTIVLLSERELNMWAFFFFLGGWMAENGQFAFFLGRKRERGNYSTSMTWRRSGLGFGKSRVVLFDF